ncbi:hypothetical protein C8Q80DRAFT_1276642 [Daedaleopsis nitida]|nr:hypothetical protein C8Q80DRAFT_1276642 [Daedaleopsis nitida]
MFHRRNTQPTLPTDIFYPICEYLDHKTLRNLSLTCHRLVAPARQQLFRDISLGRRTTESSLRLLRSRSFFGGLVHNLTIVQLQVSLIATSLPFSFFTNLQRLTLRSLNLRSWDQLFQQVLASVPSLQSLTCYAIEVKSETSPSPQIPSGHGCQAPSSPVSLASLTVKHGHFDSSVLVQHILFTTVASRLRSLDISLGSTDQHLHWLPVIRSTSQTLEHISISMSDEPIPGSVSETPDASHSLVFDALATASRLSTLGIRYCPNPILHNTPTQVGELLLVTLSSLLKRSPVPFPDLSHLTLHLVDRGQVLNQPTLDSIAHSLAKTARYPHFTRITVAVTFERWIHNAGGIWLPTRTRGEQREALYNKWREACTVFEARSGVILEIVVYPIEMS